MLMTLLRCENSSLYVLGIRMKIGTLTGLRHSLTLALLEASKSQTLISQSRMEIMTIHDGWHYGKKPWIIQPTYRNGVSRYGYSFCSSIWFLNRTLENCLKSSWHIGTGEKFLKSPLQLHIYLLFFILLLLEDTNNIQQIMDRFRKGWFILQACFQKWCYTLKN